MKKQALQVILGRKAVRSRSSPKKAPRKKPAVFLTSAKTVAGHFAMWAVRQNPYPHCPAHLDLLVGRLLYQLQKHAKKQARGNGLMKVAGIFRTDRRSLETLVMEKLGSVREFQRWNERKNGNQDPFNFVSRYDDPTKRDPDNDFIDLDALVRNVALSVAVEEGAPVPRLTTARRRK